MEPIRFWILFREQMVSIRFLRDVLLPDRGIVIGIFTNIVMLLSVSFKNSNGFAKLLLVMTNLTMFFSLLFILLLFLFC